MLAENGETAAELTVQQDGKTLEVTASQWFARTAASGWVRGSGTAWRVSAR